MRGSPVGRVHERRCFARAQKAGTPLAASIRPDCLTAESIPRISPEESDKTILRSLDQGINYFDTASAYEDSEEKLGRILSKRNRDEFTILSRSHSWKISLDDFLKNRKAKGGLIILLSQDITLSP